MRHFNRQLLLALWFIILPLKALSADDIYTGFFSNLAIGGYDSVAYFTENKAIEGDEQYSLEYKGATWQFSSPANLAAFAANPEQYAPQYGGYCAWAAAQNKTAKGDPKYWHIVNGKLYLNYDKDIKNRWLKDIPGFIQQADMHWPNLLQ